MDAAVSYLEAVIGVLQNLKETQLAGIRQAADWLVEAIRDGHRIFSFGASHSFIITEELVYRTGGLMLVNPIYPQGMNLAVRPLTLTSRLERVPGLGRELLESSPVQPGDVVLVTSTSGRNAVVIDFAAAAREKGLKVIGITALAYTRGVNSRHPSGKKLADLCDLVLDNGAPLGDAAVTIPGFPQKTGPLSTITGCAIANAMVAVTVEKLVQQKITPPVFMSANLDGGDAHNATLLAANRSRIFYLE